MTQVWSSSRATKGQLLVLLAIADFADDDGHAFPSLKVLGKKARLSVRETQNCLRQLEHLGEVKIEKRQMPHGGYGPSLYHILTPGAISAPPGEVGCTTLVQFSANGSDKSISGTATGTITPPSPPQGGDCSLLFPELASKATPKRKRQPKVTQPSEEFLTFWDAYPRHEKMARAWRAWQKANPPLAVVLESLAEHKKTNQWRRGKEYIPHPATWINDESWDDEL